MVSGRERSIGAKTTFPSHLDAALGFSLTQRPQQVVGGETTAYYATCRLPPVSSGPRALRPNWGDQQRTFVQAGGEMEHLHLRLALWSRSQAVGKVKVRRCEEREPDCAPLMAPCYRTLWIQRQEDKESSARGEGTVEDREFYKGQTRPKVGKATPSRSFSVSSLRDRWPERPHLP